MSPVISLSFSLSDFYLVCARAYVCLRAILVFLSKVEIGMIFFAFSRSEKGLIAEVCTLHPGGFHENQTQSL